MAYLLDSTTIKNPERLDVSNTTQFAENRTLSGSVNRDYFGSNKRIWVLDYTNTTKASFDIINTIYESYLSTGNAVTWEVTETNYTITETEVHVDLRARQFSVGGETYISDFDLVLTEV